MVFFVGFFFAALPLDAPFPVLFEDDPRAEGKSTTVCGMEHRASGFCFSVEQAGRGASLSYSKILIEKPASGEFSHHVWRC